MKNPLVTLALVMLTGETLIAQGGPQTPDSSVPMKRIALFSSGVGYFFHGGTLSGPAEISLAFDGDSINDALKSLTINDGATSSPIVRYASEETLVRTLKGLKVDVSGNPTLADILSSLKGEEIIVTAPTEVRGKILSVSERATVLPNGSAVTGYALSLVNETGVRTLSLDEISSIKFANADIDADLNKALDVISRTRNSNVKTLTISLSGTGRREASLGYVIPAPVWKASYRLDLSQNKPLLQGWAIVDNASENDWIDVELSLVTGKPVSFTQLLYPPYYTNRPTLPLAIAGIADARTHDSGVYPAYESEMYDGRADIMEMDMSSRPAPSPSMRSKEAKPSYSVAGGYSGTSGAAAGDQFEFTVQTPVTVMRHSAAMLPLVDSQIPAEKIHIVSGSRAALGAIHPDIAVELTNTTGMKLPAGPVTVFDGGTYAGDALMEFFPQDEKRMISFGEDLSVTAWCETKSARAVVAVSASKGVMTITHKVTFERTYTVKNASAENKQIVIEHPITRGAKLTSPSSADNTTDSLYRFRQTAPAGRTITFTVNEESPQEERVELARIRADGFALYAANAELPDNARKAMQGAAELQQKIADIQVSLSQLEESRGDLAREQERVRQNLQAAGNQTTQGQNYLLQLTGIDDRMATLAAQIASSREALRAAQKALSDYISSMKL
jgi:hypothetical protein